MRLTVFRMGGLANTCKDEIELTTGGIMTRHSFLPVLGYKNRGKRKQFAFREPDHQTLIFEGWDLPIGTDGDIKRPSSGAGFSCTSFSGNACINVSGDLAVVKDFIENKNLNDKFTDFGAILHYTDGTPSGDDGVQLYPDSYKGGHAVIDRLREKCLATGIPAGNLIVASC